MTLFVTVLHVLVCLVLIVVVLLQRGKGAEVGAVFGGGGGNTMFGARGAGNFLTRLTTAAAVTFMLTSLTLAYFARDDVGSTLFEEETAVEAEGGFEAVPDAADGAAAGEDAASDGGFEEVVPVDAADAAEPAPEAAPEADAGPSAEPDTTAPAMQSAPDEEPTPAQP